MKLIVWVGPGKPQICVDRVSYLGTLFIGKPLRGSLPVFFALSFAISRLVDEGEIYPLKNMPYTKANSGQLIIICGLANELATVPD